MKLSLFCCVVFVVVLGSDSLPVVSSNESDAKPNPSAQDWWFFQVKAAEHIEAAVKGLIRDIKLQWGSQNGNKSTDVTNSTTTKDKNTEDEATNFFLVALRELRKFKQSIPEHLRRKKEEEAERRRKNEQRRREQQKRKEKLNRHEVNPFNQPNKALENVGDMLNTILGKQANKKRPRPVQRSNSEFHLLMFDSKDGDSNQADSNQDDPNQDDSVDRLIVEVVDNDQGPKASTAERVTEKVAYSEEDLSKAQTYADYEAIVRERSKRLKEESMESLKKRTREFVKSIFENEVKELAILLAQQFIEKKPNFQQAVSNQLITQITIQSIGFLCGALTDILTYALGRSLVPRYEERPQHRI